MWPTAIVRPATAGILYAYVSVKKYKYAIHKHLQTWSRVSVQGHMLVLLDGSSNPRNQKNPKMCEMLFKSIVILHWHETTRIQCGGRGLAGDELILGNPLTTWWFIPLTKWVITPVGSGFTLLIPVISGVITHLRFVGWTTKYGSIMFYLPWGCLSIDQVVHQLSSPEGRHFVVLFQLSWGLLSWIHPKITVIFISHHIPIFWGWIIMVTPIKVTQQLHTPDPRLVSRLCLPPTSALEATDHRDASISDSLQKLERGLAERMAWMGIWYG